MLIYYKRRAHICAAGRQNASFKGRGVSHGLAEVEARDYKQ